MEDIELWRWIWVGAFVVLGIGEMVTAVCSCCRSPLVRARPRSWPGPVSRSGCSCGILVVSVGALWGMRKFAWRSTEPTHTVGAKRYVDAVGLVTEDIDRVSGSGRVRVETENWRATTDSDGVIESGTEVLVVNVRGARLVVEPRPRE